MPLVRIGTPPQPPTGRLVCPLPPVSGGRGTLAGEKGVGRVPIPTRGIHCGTLYMYVLCVPSILFYSTFIDTPPNVLPHNIPDSYMYSYAIYKNIKPSTYVKNYVKFLIVKKPTVFVYV
jgi:hypothetical protein